MGLGFQPQDNNYNAVQCMRLGTVENIADGSASASAFDSVQVVRVVSADDVYVTIGPTPTATTSDTFIPAGVVEYLKVLHGDKIAVTGGILNVTIMN